MAKNVRSKSMGGEAEVTVKRLNDPSIHGSSDPYSAGSAAEGMGVPDDGSSRPIDLSEVRHVLFLRRQSG